MLFAALMTFFGFISLAGWGRQLSRQIFDNFSAKNIGWWVIFGLFLCGWLGLLLQFFTPLVPIFSWIFMIVGFVLFFYRFQWTFTNKPSSWIWLTFLFLGFFIVTGISVDTPLTADGGLYHIQYILWSQEHPLTIGIANVHERLGLNSIWWIISAILSPHLSPEYATVTANSIIVMAVIFILLPRKGSNPIFQLGFWFLLSIFIFWGKPVLFDQLGSPAPDLPVSFLSILCIFILLTELISPTNSSKIHLKLVAVALLGIMIKPSSLPLIGALPVLMLAQWIKGTSQNFTSIFRKYPKILILFATTTLLWVIRNFLLSGCWLFPAVTTCFPEVTWTVPQQITQSFADGVKAWARTPYLNPDIVLKDSSWMKDWWHRTYHHPPIRDFIKIILLTFITISICYRKYLQDLLKKTTYFTPAGIWILGSILFWFLLAPDLRFGAGTLTATMAVLMFIIFVHLQKKWIQNTLLIYLSFLFLTGSFPHYFLTSWRGTSNYPLYKSIDTSTFPAIKEYRSFYDVKYRAPEDPSHFDQCWFAKPPCSQIIRNDLAQGEWFGYTMYFQHSTTSKAGD